MTTRLVLIALAALAWAAACRPGEGQRCICEGECRRGLVCAQGGRVLEDKECVDPGDRTPAECIEQDDLPDMADEGFTPTDFVYHDLGGKRDFEPGPPPDESSSTDATTSAESSTTTSAESSTSSTGTASSSSTGAP